MKPHILLTPELRAKVENKMRECIRIAEKHYGISIPMPEVRFDIKSWTGGLAYRNRNLVRYNLILLVENEKHYLDSTVPHETAHMIVNECFRQQKFILAPGKRRWMPHGKEWKEVMALLSVQPNVKHTYDCSSIERFAKHKRKNDSSNRVARIMRQISRLTEEERQLLENMFHTADV